MHAVPLSVETKLSKTQITKIIQSGGFVGKRFGPLGKTGLPSAKNILTSLVTSVLIPVNAGIEKKRIRS